MDISERVNIGERLVNKGVVRINNNRFTWQNGLVYADKYIKGFENIMTWDTFVHVYLDKIK